jgi:Ca2+-binding RTX toxin-like protein
MRLTEWLSGWRTDGSASRRRASRIRTPSLAELLEPRALLSGGSTTAATIALNTTTHEVVITGTSYADIATVSAPTATTVKVRVVTGSKAVEATYATTDVAKITFNAGARNDSLTNTTDRPVNMNGGDGNDTLIGGSGNDTFAGGNGDDSVNGGLGDDVFGGSPGNDFFDGGLGNDLLSMSADANFVLTDTSLTGIGTNTLANLERVQITGGLSANTIDASLATLPLTLNGGGGNDSIIGGLGNDSINGGDGLDTLNGFSGDDTVLGGTGDDFLQGGSGVDFVDGGDGNDNVLGSGGSGDTVRGGLGNDTLDGGDGLADVISESADVSFTLTPTQLIGLGTDSILNIEGVQLVGGVSANKFDVSTSLLPTTLTGGLGNDTFLGSAAVDLVVESGDVNFTVTNTQLTGAGNDVFSGIDRVRINGGIGANLLNASATSMRVTLNGGDGNDTLIGGSAADRLDGGTGNDQLTGNLGADTLIGGDGVDRLVESGNTSFGLSNASLVGFQTDTIFTFEEAELTGGASANSLTVSNFPGPVTLHGGGGNDTLEGTPFNDLLDGGAGDDLVSGEEGNDLLQGGDGNDTLNGGSGDDSLAGGLGNDNLYGDTGNDTASGDAGNDTLQGRLGDDSLDGGADADIVLGQQGNDTVLGGTGRDIVIGGQDHDSVNGGDDDDIVLGGSYKYDLDFTALTSVLANWNGTAAYLDRVNALQNTAYPYFLKSLAQITDNATVYDDYSTDTVSGGIGQDFVLRPGEPGLPTMDVTPDFDSTLEVMNVSVFGTEAAGFFPSNMTKPGYLATINDPTFGTPITRITGDVGTSLTLPVNVGGTASIYWSGAVRTHYVTESSWNIDGSLMMLRSYDPAMPYQIVLNGSTYQPLFVASLPSTNYRWSQNPATPNVQYGFLEQNVPDAKGTALEGTAAPLPAAGPDDDKIVRCPGRCRCPGRR